MIIKGCEYTLRFLDEWNYEMEREGHRVALTASSLWDGGPNTLMKAAELIERKIRGEFVALNPAVSD